MANEVFVLEVNHNNVPVRHGDHKSTSIRCPDDLLIGELLLAVEELSIDVCEDADDRARRYFVAICISLEIFSLVLCQAVLSGPSW